MAGAQNRAVPCLIGSASSSAGGPEAAAEAGRRQLLVASEDKTPVPDHVFHFGRSG